MDTTDPRHDVFVRVADDIAGQVKRVFHEPPLDPTPVKLEAYRHLDLKWYRRATSTLEALQFRVARDVDGGAAVAPGSPVPLVRVLLSADGRTSAALYHMKPSTAGAGPLMRLLLWVLGKWPADAKVVECMSYAGDAVLSTSNQGAANTFQPPPGMSREQLPLGTSVEAVVAMHQARLTSWGHAPEVIADFETLQARRNEQLRRSHAWREEVGLLPVELDAMLAAHGEFGVLLRPYVERALAARRAQS